MYWPFYWIETIGMIIVFTGLIMVPLCKDPVWWIHDYPKDIQEEYFKSHECIPIEPLSKTVVMKKGFVLYQEYLQV